MITGKTLRAFALSLPEAEERETWGEATFRVRDRIFTIMSPDERRAGVKASLDDQAALVAAEPRTYRVAPYTGRYGWVSVTLRTVDPDEMRDLVTEAWRKTAPKRLVKEFDART
ncbi:MAG: MmcQ/YjbR family DNA-binding protein [Actinomycetota bacterium]